MPVVQVSKDIHLIQLQLQKGCINRVGEEKPWNIGKFYGQSYFVDPRGQIFAEASRDNDELLIAEFDLDLIDEVRSTWQFFRDRRPETYGDLTKL